MNISQPLNALLKLLLNLNLSIFIPIVHSYINLSTTNDEFKIVGLLTQIIKPKSKRRIGPTSSTNSITEEQTFLEKITVLDKATAHQELLKISKSKGRVPTKL